MWPSPDGEQPVPDGYPALEVGPQAITIQIPVVPIQPGAKAAAFRQSLRVCLREPAIGRTIPISYSLHSKRLRAPLSGRLQINVVDDAPSVQTPRADGI